MCLFFVHFDTLVSCRITWLIVYLGSQLWRLPIATSAERTPSCPVGLGISFFSGTSGVSLGDQILGVSLLNLAEKQNGERPRGVNRCQKHMARVLMGCNGDENAKAGQMSWMRCLMQKTRLTGCKIAYVKRKKKKYYLKFDQMFGLRFLKFWFLVHFCWFLFL